MALDRPLILHVACDYPGPYSPTWCTRAISDMVSAADSMRHAELVPLRTKKQFKTRIQRVGTALHVSLFDPVATLLPGHSLRLDWISLCNRQLLDGRVPDVVHSHKLSYEARIGARIARALRVPHIITVQGSSDTHSHNHWPWTRSTYRRLLSDSACNLWMSAWAQAPIERLTGYVSGTRDVLWPCVVPDAVALQASPSADFDADSLVCICRLDDYVQKGIPALLAGLALARTQRPGLRLDLIGPASSDTQHALLALIGGHGLSDAVTLVGPVPRDELISRLSRYAGLVMVSGAESFGLVYVEALLAGVPIVYRQGSGVDGHLFAKAHGLVCADVSTPALADVLLSFAQQQHALRTSLHEALARGDLQHLHASSQASIYQRLVESVIQRRAVDSFSLSRAAA